MNPNPNGIWDTFQKIDNGVVSSMHLHILQLDLQKVNIKRKELFSYLQQQGIGVNVHYMPIVAQPYYQRLGFKLEDYPNSALYYSRSITIPLFPELTDQDQEYIVGSIKSALR